MCTALLPPGVNPIAVNKYSNKANDINREKKFFFTFSPLCGSFFLHSLLYVVPFFTFSPLCGSFLFTFSPLCGSFFLHSLLYVVPFFYTFSPLCGSFFFTFSPLCGSLLKKKEVENLK